MNLDLLLNLVKYPGNLQSSHQEALESLVQEYPYFTAAHLLLLKLYKEQNSIHFNKQLRKVAALAPSREHVYDLVEVLPLLDELASPEALAVASTTDEAVEAPGQAVSEEVLVDVESDLTAPSVSAPSEWLQPEIAAVLADEREAVVAEAPEAAVQPEEEAKEEVAASTEMEMPEGSEEIATPLEESARHEPQEEPMALADERGTAESLVVESVQQDEASRQMAAADPAVDAVDDFVGTVEVTETPLLAGIDAATTPSGVEAGQEQGRATEADFISHTHDRLSWFRYFAGKPLREQPDDVLEQLYMEHMQQDLLKAPETAPETSIKAKINFAEEVESSVSMEEEIKRLAYDSISDDELPASETLARIYEQQNEYKRAIKIYQKLILKFPDKMTYFAGLIEELRKKS